LKKIGNLEKVSITKVRKSSITSCTGVYMLVDRFSWTFDWLNFFNQEVGCIIRTSLTELRL